MSAPPMSGPYPRLCSAARGFLIRSIINYPMLKVNLLDQSFRPDMGSTRWQLPTKFEFVRDLESFDGVSIFVDGHILNPNECDSPIKIAWLHEPPCLGEMHTIYNDVMHISHNYSRILTYHPGLLALDPSKYFKLEYGGVWVPEDHWRLYPKPRLCSMLIGSKMSSEGHRIRHEIADKVTGRVDFYGVRGIPVGYEMGTKLIVHRDHCFSLVCECCRIDNLFTEITLDCFACGTVPVLWGVPNVADYFDVRGILQFETADECLDIVRLLTPALYESMQPYITVNMELMREYAHPDDTQLYEKYLKEYDNES